MTCGCKYCERNRKYIEVVEKFVPEEHRKFMEGILDALLNEEETLEWYKLKINELRKNCCKDKLE